jgi:hypothetical protein
LGIGRSFLSTYLNQAGAEELALARALWAYKRITGRALDKEQLESHLSVAEAPAMHLAALQKLRAVAQRDLGPANGSVQGTCEGLVTPSEA